MKKTLVIASLASMMLLNAMPHHGDSKMQCNVEMIQKQAKNPSEEINALMHAPMMCAPWVESKNIEVDFLKNMIPHHEGAILSSKALLKYAKNEKLIKIAHAIIEAQEREIKDFQELLKKLDKKESKDYAKFAKEAKADMDKMMKDMHAVHPSGDVEKDYMQAMIAHHQGAIDAAKQVLKYTKNKQIIKIAQDIIKAQEQEIEDFQKLLKE